MPNNSVRRSNIVWKSVTCFVGKLFDHPPKISILGRRAERSHLPPTRGNAVEMASAARERAERFEQAIRAAGNQSAAGRSAAAAATAAATIAATTAGTRTFRPNLGLGVGAPHTLSATGP